MPSRLKALIKYLVIIAAMILLVWYSLKGMEPGEGQSKYDVLLNKWEQANKLWLSAMAIIMMVSHVIRAERWKMLLASAGYKTSLGNNFISVMVGYVVNLFIPRGGEVSRCYNLYKLDKTPVDVSFGTVVIERVVDLICFCILIVLVFIVESKKLFSFLNTLPISMAGVGSKLLMVLYTLLAGVFFWVLVYRLIRKNQKIKGFLVKTWKGIKTGLLTVFKLEKKGLFILYSFLIWFLYFITSYAVIMAFPSTEHLGFSAILSLFGIGSLAMLVPLPGGTGSYHTLVPAGLIFLYHIPETDAKAFTFVFHGWQTLITFAVGIICLIITAMKVKRQKKRS